MIFEATAWEGLHPGFQMGKLRLREVPVPSQHSQWATEVCEPALLGSASPLGQVGLRKAEFVAQNGTHLFNISVVVSQREVWLTQ